MSDNTEKPTKMNREDINQDHLSQKDQQRTDDSALDMMKGLHDHENHDEEEEE